MSRGLWFVAGAGAGVYAAVRARRVAEAFTPDGLADRLAGLSLGAHLFGQEVREEAAAREGELRERLGPPSGPPALDSPAVAGPAPRPGDAPAARTPERPERGTH